MLHTHTLIYIYIASLTRSIPPLPIFPLAQLTTAQEGVGPHPFGGDATPTGTETATGFPGGLIRHWYNVWKWERFWGSLIDQVFRWLSYYMSWRQAFVFSGGVVSLLALNGLFILMHHYHLWVLHYPVIKNTILYGGKVAFCLENLVSGDHLYTGICSPWSKYHHRSSPIFPIMWYVQGLSWFLFQTVRVAGAVCVPCQVHASILQSYGHLPQFHVSPRNNFEVSDKNFCVTILKFLQALATVHGCSFRQKDSSVGSECTPTR